uniref:Uncharacterized protein n=1 Tax=Cryptomonas curvata TaxID=233186 RepID=A0A7S0MH91_9CRYP|mmetsp:Transcript_41254/g.86164  ORF Transcript_41254/g.86164 Transcript_41254/m.86164 type:complete len:165 (+) Transcript_41254:322-816(+)
MFMQKKLLPQRMRIILKLFPEFFFITANYLHSPSRPVRSDQAVMPTPCPVFMLDSRVVTMCLRLVLLGLVLCIACFTIPALAAMPPGYEDVVLCKAGSCLRRIPREPEWSGGKHAFWQCCDPSTGKLSNLFTWGSEVDEQCVLDRQLSYGWAHAYPCIGEQKCL